MELYLNRERYKRGEAVGALIDAAVSIDREHRRKKHTVAWVMTGLLTGVLVVAAFMYGVRKQEQVDFEIRSARCASWGESIPAELEGYCEGLGV